MYTRSIIRLPRKYPGLSGLSGMGSNISFLDVVPPEGLTESYIEAGTSATRRRLVPRTIRITESGTGALRDIENPDWMPPGWLTLATAAKADVPPQWRPPVPLTKETFLASRPSGYQRTSVSTTGGGYPQQPITYVPSAQFFSDTYTWGNFGVANGFIKPQEDNFIDKTINTAITVAVVAGIGYGLVHAAGSIAAGATAAPTAAAPVATATTAAAPVSAGMTAQAALAAPAYAGTSATAIAATGAGTATLSKLATTALKTAGSSLIDVGMDQAKQYIAAKVAQISPYAEASYDPAVFGSLAPSGFQRAGDAGAGAARSKFTVQGALPWLIGGAALVAALMVGFSRKR